MTLGILFLVIFAQILLFQIMAALANRTVMQQELRALDRPAPRALTDHIERAPRLRVTLGVLLGCVAALPLFGIPSDPGLGKLLLALVSVGSAIGFARAQVQDRAMMRLLADQFPGGGLRRASLEPRSLRQWYHPVLEVIPILIFVATGVFLLGATGFGFTDPGSTDVVATGGRTHVFVLFGLQGLFVFGGLYRSIRKSVDVGSMAQYIPSLRNRPADSLRLGGQLAGTQLRFFMFAKVAIALLLASTIIEHVYEATSQTGAALWDAVGWSMVGVLLIGFFFYLQKVGRISRRAQQEGNRPDHSATSVG